MKKEDESGFKAEDSLVGLSADILRGRQSVRATFRLPPQIIALLSAAANQLGLKQKSLFDQLVEDREILEQLAGRADHYQPLDEIRQQKTYVVSRKALLSLEHVARSCDLPRDLLVELSIQRLVPVLNLEQEKKQKRQLVLGKLEMICQQNESLWQETVDMLGEDDSTAQLVAALQSCCQRAANELAQLVERGQGA
ncbi:MAG: hypothetical protein AB7U29_19840 [Desulfobulbus sp.]